MKCYGHRTVLPVLLAVWLFQPAAEVGTGPMTRGRVRVQGNTIISDWGTQLRGGCWSEGKLFARDELGKMKMAGLNAVHLYGEAFGRAWTAGNEPGCNAEAYIDKIVDWCREDSVYLILTLGGPKTWSGFADYTRRYWKFYAPRYANQTHVVYEILNEGCMNTSHCVDSVMELYRECYKIIRDSAPDTHILLLSHSNLTGGTNSLWDDVDRLSDVVDWKNASFAFHGYGPSAAFQEQACKELGAKGYGMTCTEFPFAGGAELAKAYERAEISYTWFEACWGGARTLGNIGNYIKGLGITWQPDFGTWPQAHVDHIPLGTRRSPVPSYRRMPESIARLSLRGGGTLTGATAVYDITGRLLWQRSSDADPGGNTRLDSRAGMGTGMFILKYGK